MKRVELNDDEQVLISCILADMAKAAMSTQSNLVSVDFKFSTPERIALMPLNSKFQHALRWQEPKVVPPSFPVSACL